jgi:transketolase
VLLDSESPPEIIFIATGSEVGLAMRAASALRGEGIAARVVSMPCTHLFDAEPEAYRESVLPPETGARVVIEAGVGEFWWRYAGPGGRVVAMDGFGESAPAEELFTHFGFTVNHVLSVAKELLAG